MKLVSYVVHETTDKLTMKIEVAPATETEVAQNQLWEVSTTETGGLRSWNPSALDIEEYEALTPDTFFDIAVTGPLFQQFESLGTILLNLNRP